MNSPSPFKQGILGGVTAMVVAIVIFAAGAVAAQEILDPEDATGSSDRGQAVGAGGALAPGAVDSAGGVLQVFQTSATFNGAGPAGYGRSGMHAACREEDPTSHFCTIQEIENAWKTSGIDIVVTGQAWIDNAVVGTVNSDYGGDTSAASDWFGGSVVGDYPYNCNAWTVSGNSERGLILNTGAISPATEACDDIHPIACCK